MVDLSPIPDPSTAEDARSRLLQAATRLFGARGFDATSLQAIADEVGIRKQSLLYHFPSKEALHAHVIEASLLHWRDELPRLMATTSSYDRFSATIAALLSFFRDDPNRARLTLREMLDRPEALRRRMEELLSPWIRLLTDYIRMGQASGYLRPEVQPEAYVIQVLMMVLSTVAIGDVAAGIAGAAGRPDDGELVRMAREALFVHPPTPAPEG